jgi:GH24 family phage-related lysozyme (muramidase)
MDLDPSLIAAVKGFEGFAPKSSWDYKQYTNGYGTRAQSPNETIDPATAEARLNAELGKAQGQVDALGVQNMPPGVRNALTSLTFNAGPGWMNSGLGEAVKAGDWNKAQGLFLNYNKAGGQENPGLMARRQQEAQWFGQPTAPFQAIPPAQAPQGMPLFGAQMAAGTPSAAGLSGAPQQAPANPAASLGSFFGQMSAPPAQAPAMPMASRPAPPDLSKLYAFLQSQQVS